MEKLLINSILILCLTNDFAQNYSFSVRNEPFAELANPIQITGTIPWENPDDTLDIGFNFLFFAATIDRICFYTETQAGMLFGLPSTEDNFICDNSSIKFNTLLY